MIELRSSGIGTFQGCPRKYHNLYELGYQSIDDNWILLFGLGIHGGLEGRGKGCSIGNQRKLFKADSKGIPAHQQVVGECLLMLYNEAYRDEGIEYKHVEYAFSIELDGFTFRGKFDGLCIDSHGRWFIMEHKTTRSDLGDDSKYWRYRDMNTQIDLYMWAARKLGFPVEYMMYDVLKVPQMKPLKRTPVAKQQFYKKKGKFGDVGDPRPGTRLKNESGKEFEKRVMEYVIDNKDTLLRRVEMERSGKENQLAFENLCGIHTLVATMARPKNTDHCHAYGGECEFKPVCMGETSLTNTGLYEVNEDPLGY